MRKERRHYTAEERVAILRRHLLDKVPVSDLCEELGLLALSGWSSRNAPPHFLSAPCGPLRYCYNS